MTSPAILLPFLKDLRVLVLGMGREGVSSAKAALRSGARVTVTDDFPESLSAGFETLQSYARDLGELPTKDASAKTMAFYPPQAVEAEKVDVACFDMVIVSPGVSNVCAPNPHPLVVAALRHNVRLTGNTDLFFQAKPQGRFVGVSGTNGKSSTVSMIHWALEKLGCKAVLAGNIGCPLLDLSPPTADQVTVIELSSYQLDQSPNLALDAALLLPITPDHLDRYHSFDDYEASKKRLLDSVKPGGHTFYAAGCPIQSAWAKESSHKHWVPVGSKSATQDCGFYIHEAQMCRAGKGDFALSLADWPVHLSQGLALGALAIVSSLGFAPEKALLALKSWPGLPHRLEPIPSNLPIHFINDSKATNVASAKYALNNCDGRPLFWLCGGRLKQDDPLKALLPLPKSLKAVFAFGEGRGAFYQFLKPHAPACFVLDSLDQAVHAAVRQAKTEASSSETEKPIILLSPAGSSFDAFQNFEKRGQHFKELVSLF